LRISGAGETTLIGSDGTWKATLDSGWSNRTPRRSWAIGHVEDFDAATAPAGWQRPDFDDRAWTQADVRPHFRPGEPGDYRDAGTPPLRFRWQPAVSVLAFHWADRAAHPLNPDDADDSFGKALAEEPWTEPEGLNLEGTPDANGGNLLLEGMEGGRGSALVLDLGEEYVGACSFELESESPGLIDIGWGECLEANGRPSVARKSNTYADRYHAIAGANAWLPHTFNAGRYLLLVFRGFTGNIRIHKAGMLSSEPDCRFVSAFSAPGNPRLEAIWYLCERTVRRGTQEGLMDCPTREQASYVGDGNQNASWFARLCGDFSHWRRLVTETFAVQGEDGHIKTMVFSGMTHLLLDYSLLAVIGARDYMLATGDMDTIRQSLEPCRRLLQWFGSHQDSEGLLNLCWENFDRKAAFLSPPSRPVTPDAPASPYRPRKGDPVGTRAADTLHDPGWNLFIDHPGMGWHNLDDPGIDRRGQNAALNALHAMAMQAMATMEDACHESGAPDWHRRAGRLAQAIHHTFWNPREGAYADGRLQGELLAQVSQQTNTWCIMAGACPAGLIPGVWRRILDPQDTRLARSGPYFWSYMLPALAASGMAREALAEVTRLYGAMLDQGASLAWETFAGDRLDSRCHPWSCAPLDFLLRHMAGIGDLPAGKRQLELRPRTDLLDSLDATACTAQGPVRIAWKTMNGKPAITAQGPDGITLDIRLPDGRLYGPMRRFPDSPGSKCVQPASRPR
jgi:hypothetical protein